MATFQLTVSPGYAHEWGIWHALREILQNALDEDDNGHKFSVKWTPGNGGTLVVKNEGSVIQRRHLILGESDKRDDARMRGKFGEGFKLALLVLARKGIKVRLQTGDETWHAEIAHSKEFDTQLLQIRTTPRKYEDSVEYWISPVDKESYQLVCDRILPLQKKVNRIHTYHGDLLLDEKFKGKVFVKGIYVCDHPKSEYGYDFRDMSLDRDRKMADYYSLNYAITNVLRTAVYDGKFEADKLFEIANSDDSAESKAISIYGMESMAEKLRESFEKKHGKDTIAVSSVLEATQASEVGLKAVVVTKAVSGALKSESILQARIESKKTDAKKIVQLDELTEEERSVLNAGLKLTACLGKTLPVRIVEFHGDILGSTVRDQWVNVSRTMLKSVGDFVTTLVHEYAHEASSDHDLVHGAEMESLFTTILNNHLK